MVQNINNYSDVTKSIAHHLSFMSKGDKAEIRNMDVMLPKSRAFWKLVNNAIPREFRTSKKTITAWAVVARGMCESKKSVHDSKSRFGTVLAKIGFSEERFTQLINYQPNSDVENILRVCRFATKAKRNIDWTGIALLMAGKPETVEKVKRTWARDYFGVTNPVYSKQHN